MLMIAYYVNRGFNISTLQGYVDIIEPTLINYFKAFEGNKPQERGKLNMVLYIKYMVSLRCKMMVKEELTKLGIHYLAVDLGMVDLTQKITMGQRRQLEVNLAASGFELLDDKKSILINKIKSVIVGMIDNSDELSKTTYSEYISAHMDYDYTYLSNIFSEVKGITIQQFIIIHKIEKVKELLLYDELSLTGISRKLCYSSVAHLSNQFKKVTGLSPSFYKQLKQKRSMNKEDLIESDIVSNEI